MKSAIFGLIIYYISLCIATIIFPAETWPTVHVIIDGLLKSGPYVAAIVSLGIALYANRPPKKPILKFSIATDPANTSNKIFFSQQYKNNSGQTVTQQMVRLICSNESDVLAEDVTVELVSATIPSPLNWTHQNPNLGISKSFDERKILPKQKAYLDLLQDDGNLNFSFASMPIMGTQYRNVPRGKQTLKMVYHTKNGTHGNITVELDNNGTNTTLLNLKQD
jgi:hypothetical protein